MIEEEIIYCVKEHSYQCYRFIVGQKYIFKLFGDSNYRTIYDTNNNLIVFFFDNQHYNFDRLKYFISENEYRKRKLKKLNESNL